MNQDRACRFLSLAVSSSLWWQLASSKRKWILRYQVRDMLSQARNATYIPIPC
ncbi:MAG: hypothetical protein LUQ70_02670 [Methanobacteriaceae archaeon]|nr:hypothetical protein [Methanobacteriaceae archaeon]